MTEHNAAPVGTDLAQGRSGRTARSSVMSLRAQRGRYWRQRSRDWGKKAIAEGRSRGLLPTALSPWPVIAPFAFYLLWWVLGVGDTIWILCAAIILVLWCGVRGFRIPSVGYMWLFFLLWVAASLFVIDTPGRMVGAVYRLALYASAGIIAAHFYNVRARLSLRMFLVAMSAFLACATAGGYLAMLLPELVVRTPMSFLLPDALLRNELVNEMVIRRTTQWNPNAWIVQTPRPAAPFLYANTWGNVYSLLLPLSLLHVYVEWQLRSKYRWIVLALCVSSTWVASATLNRGMYVGLFVVALWVAFQMLRAGHWKETLMGVGVLGVAFVAWSLSSASDNLSQRVSTTNSTDDRQTLYWETFIAVLKSPLLGYGAPRPSLNEWLPSLGTQGQLWTVLFSHGFVGLLFFMGFFGWALAESFRRLDIVGAVCGGVIAATLVETIFYGMMTGVMISVLVVAVLAREDRAPERSVSWVGKRPGVRFSSWDPQRRSLR